MNVPRILNKVENNQFGLFLASTWKKLIDKYVPRRDGLLMQTVDYRPFTFTYKQPYAHYMYNGKVYVDPALHVSGFTNDGGATWFSRKDIKKIPTDRSFNYRKDPNPYATDHWDVAAEKSGQKQKLIISVNKYLRRLG